MAAFRLTRTQKILTWTGAVLLNLGVVPLVLYPFAFEAAHPPGRVGLGSESEWTTFLGWAWGVTIAGVVTLSVGLGWEAIKKASARMADDVRRREQEAKIAKEQTRIALARRAAAEVPASFPAMVPPVGSAMNQHPPTVQAAPF
ncbi:MAG TPA: hypothetical protein VGB25_10885, partial [Candidatus Binatia bacterium]